MYRGAVTGSIVALVAVGSGATCEICWQYIVSAERKTDIIAGQRRRAILGLNQFDATSNASRAASTTGTEAPLEFGVEIGGITGDWRKLKGVPRPRDRPTGKRFCRVIPSALGIETCHDVVTSRVRYRRTGSDKGKLPVRSS